MTSLLPSFEWNQASGETSVTVQFHLNSSSISNQEELQVKLNDSGVLTVSHHQEEILFKLQLFDSVRTDEMVQWSFDDATQYLTVTLQKESADLWPSLLREPINSEETFDGKPLLLTTVELDRYCSWEIPQLPAEDDSSEKDILSAEENAADEFDRLLDEALDETLPKSTCLNEKLSDLELESFDKEASELREQLEEVQRKLQEQTTATEETVESTGDTEDKKDEPDRELLAKKEFILHDLLQKLKRSRELRSKPVTLDRMLKYQVLELKRARIALGLPEEDTEEFADASEEAMTPLELMQKGISHLEASEMVEAMHFLRLAVIQHRHSTSTLLLHRFYSQLGRAELGALVLFSRAMEPDNDEATNFLVGSLHDQGANHFPPFCGLSLHFYQRAAQKGSVSAMLAMYRLLENGGSAASITSAEDRQIILADPQRAAGWFRAALTRGSAAAYIAAAHRAMTAGNVEETRTMAERVRRTLPNLLSQIPSIEEFLKERTTDESSTVPKEQGQQQIPPIFDDDLSDNDDDLPTTVAKPTMPNSHTTQQTKTATRSSLLGSALSQRRSKATAATSSKTSSRFHVYLQRFVRFGALAHALYILMFPVRVFFLTSFFDLITPFVELITGSIETESSGMF